MTLETQVRGEISMICKNNRVRLPCSVNYRLWKKSSARPAPLR